MGCLVVTRTRTRNLTFKLKLKQHVRKGRGLSELAAHALSSSQLRHLLRISHLKSWKLDIFKPRSINETAKQVSSSLLTSVLSLARCDAGGFYLC